jgi:hypothetical protein
LARFIFHPLQFLYDVSRLSHALAMPVFPPCHHASDIEQTRYSQSSKPVFSSYGLQPAFASNSVTF